MPIEKFEIRAAKNLTNVDDIYRCLNNLYSTKAGSLPLNRDFGLNWNVIDSPSPNAEGDFALDVIAKTEKYESRVLVSEVTFTYTDKGIIPTIHIEKGDDFD